MRCSRFRKHLIPYIEGTLTERLQKPMREHAAACESCACELAELTQTVHVLRQTEYPAAEPAADLCSKVMARIAQEPVRRPWFAGKLQAYTAAAAALLVFAIALAALEPFLSQMRQVSRSPSLPQPQQAVKAPAAPPKAPSTGDERRVVVADGHARHVGAPTEKPRHLGAAPRAKAYDELQGFRSRGVVEGATAAPGSRPKRQSRASGTRLPCKAGKEGELAFEKPAEEALGKEPAAPGPASPAAQSSAPATRQSAELGYTVVTRDEDAFDKSRKQQADETALIYEKKLKKSPNNRAILEKLLEAYRDAGRAEDEYAIAKRLVNLDPANAKYWFERAQAAERARMPRTAAAAYRQAIGLKLAEPDLGLAKSRLEALETERGARP